MSSPQPAAVCFSCVLGIIMADEFDEYEKLLEGQTNGGGAAQPDQAKEPEKERSSSRRGSEREGRDRSRSRERRRRERERDNDFKVSGRSSRSRSRDRRHRWALRPSSMWN